MNRSISEEQTTLQDICATIRCPTHTDQFISFLNIAKSKDENYQRCRCALHCSLDQEEDLQINTLHRLLKEQSISNNSFIELQQSNFQTIKKQIITQLEKKKEEFMKFLEQQYKYLEKIENDTQKIIWSIKDKSKHIDNIFQSSTSDINWTTLNKLGDLLSNKIGRTENKEWAIIEDIITKQEKQKIIEQVSLLEMIATAFNIKSPLMPCLNNLSGHQHTVNYIVISNKEQYFASTSDDLTIKLWDSKESQLIRTYKHQSGTVLTVAFSMDDRFLISGGEDTLIYFWDINRTHHLLVKDGHTYSIFHILMTNDNNFISCSGDKTLRIWYQQSSKKVNLEAVPNRMAMLKSQEWLGVALTSGKVLLINQLNFQEDQQILFDAHPNEDCTGLSFSNDGYIITCGNSITKPKQLLIWQLSKEPKLCRRLELDIQPFEVCYSQDNQYIFISSIQDNKVAIYSNYGYKQLANITIPKGYSGQTNIYKHACIAIAKDSSFFLTGGYDNNVKLVTLTL